MTRSARHADSDPAAAATFGAADRGASQVIGGMSLVIFLIVLLCFVAGLLGLLFDPSVREEWGGLHYLFLMTLPAFFLSPIGLVLGLVGLNRQTVLPLLGVILNGGALLVFLVWRSTN